jgi:predicted CoA-binding protein
MNLKTDPNLGSSLINRRSIHILGAGLNKERNAHKAVGELSKKGWRSVPVHPRDAGATISGTPIRYEIERDVELDVVVLFLAPERARNAVRNLLLREIENPPLIWFQPGAEDETTISWLNDAGWDFVYNDCIVKYVERNNLRRTISQFPWFRQVQDKDDSGCSIWTVHEASDDVDLPNTKLEWVGGLVDLLLSSNVIPKYIRSLVNENESLEECARRLAS